MRALTEPELVSVWERTRNRPPLGQALEYLDCVAPGDRWQDLAFGRMCRGLFELRTLMFGATLPGVVACPRCAERLEFCFDCTAMDAGPPGEARVRVEAAGASIDLRLPTARDLEACRSSRELLARCGAPPDPGSDWIDAAAQRVADADPLVEVLLDLDCPACRHRWQALLDIVTYLTQELAHQARQLLNDVHHLASAYGWAERDILALAPGRRRAYLELVGA